MSGCGVLIEIALVDVLTGDGGPFITINPSNTTANSAKKLPELPKDAKILLFNYDGGERYFSVEGLY